MYWKYDYQLYKYNEEDNIVEDLRMLDASGVFIIKLFEILLESNDFNFASHVQNCNMYISNF